MKQKYLLFLLVLSVLFVACKGKKNKPSTDDNKKTEIISKSDSNSKLTSESDPLLLKAKDFYNNQDTFSTVELKFDVKVKTADKNISASGTLRILNDSLIWVYLKAFGFEAGRAVFTPDSVKAIVPLKKQYFAGDYNYLKQFFPVDIDFDILQSIFLNKFFIFPKNDASNLVYYKPVETENVLELSTFGFSDYSKNYGIDNSIKLDTQSKRVTENYALLPIKNQGLRIKYSELSDFGMHKLPKEVTFEGVGTSFSVTFEYGKASFGKKLSFPLSIPSNYTPFKF